MNNLKPQKLPERRWLALKISCAVLVTGLALGLRAAPAEVYIPTNISQPDYVKCLKAMDEPSLFIRQDPARGQTYRFLWVRSFHDPIAIRIDAARTETTLRFVRLRRDSSGGMRVVESRTATLAKQQWDCLTALLGKAHFWQLPEKEAYEAGTDGSNWILEGVDNSRYHVVDRWYPTMEAPQRHLEDYVAACTQFLKLANLDLRREKIY